MLGDSSGFDASHAPRNDSINSSPPQFAFARRVGWRGPARSAAGGGRFRASACRIAPCAFASSWRPMRARGEAAVEHGGDGFPIQSGDAAGDQHAVVAQALHHRADHVDARAGQFGEGCDRLGVFPLFGKRQQLRLVELAVFGQRRDEAARRRRNRACATFRGWRRRRPRRSRSRISSNRCGGARDNSRARTASVALRSNCWRCSAGRSTRMPVSTARCRIGSPPASARWHNRSPTSARRDW